jgi:hypothetical protein
LKKHTQIRSKLELNFLTHSLTTSNNKISNIRRCAKIQFSQGVMVDLVMVEEVYLHAECGPKAKRGKNYKQGY